MLQLITCDIYKNYLSSKTNPILMSSNLYPPPPDPFIFIWLFLLLAIFLIIPYLYVKFVEGRLKSFLEKLWHRVSFEFSRKFQWLQILRVLIFSVTYYKYPPYFMMSLLQNYLSLKTNHLLMSFNIEFLRTLYPEWSPQSSTPADIVLIIIQSIILILPE